MLGKRGRVNKDGTWRAMHWHVTLVCVLAPCLAPERFVT